MIATLCNQESITFNCIYQTVAAINSSRPEPSKLVLERFRFTDTGKRFTLNIPNKNIYALEHCLVGRLPVEVVFPCYR